MTDEDLIEIIEMHQLSASHAKDRRLDEVENMNMAFRHVLPDAKPIPGYIWFREDSSGYLRWYKQNIDSSG